IADYAFNGCSSFTSITIPGSVTSMSHGAFYGCSGLTAVCIPESVTSFGKYVFKNCTNLAGVCYEGSNVPEFGESMFDGDEGLNYVCVPATYMGESWGSKDVMKSGHQVTIEPATATCTEPGLSEGSHCSYCGKVLVAQEVIPASHTYSHTVVDPTCTEVGYTTHTCSVCEFTYNSDTIDAKGHKADSVEFENIVPATCTAVGSKDSVVFCSVCEVELSREEKEITALGHSYSATVVAPTCTEIGYTTHTCSVCEYTYNSDTIAAPGHSYSTAVIAPTCTAVGYTTHTCSVCEHAYNSDTVAANGHTEVTDAAVPATCTAAGKTEGKHCSVCNAVLVAQKDVAVLGHEFKDYIYNNDATTTADGTETATCTRGCGATDTRPAAGTKLEETPEKGTAVAESATNAVTIYAHHNTIVVENATDEISVYNAMGTLICRDATPCVRTEINVNAPGVYIVKTGNSTKRLVIQ
ncbi:MAG: leucine-rich repeat domain-containing protein, partial [Salinivirgaceae bacterium]|nr:leucine-rich repeat domain-containing protein [Salinivirgaceae bacterium]